ncbi:MAG: preprotein translocase subunit SecE [Lachnospiraceae bacterium]|jgi:preprotein translocase subunit SecE|nr:preprotein translocase subunit SecE [Lachnospiraceae bacterium]MBQ1852406.1 preprotein translocase subunit SecE [Lachnospiraceae bacterium]MCR5530461.1 preprotein translocase subunit SecE [Lachnospiraceae bacterium]
MADNEKAPKKSFFKGLKAEFKKIIWPSRDKVVKESGVVLVISVVLGLVIFGVDILIKLGLGAILGLSF